MTPRAPTTHRSSLMESVSHQLHSWKPFQLHQTLTAEGHPSKPYLFPTKKPCRSDRSTAPPPIPDPAIDLSKLSLREENNLLSRPRDDPLFVQDGYKRWFARKRRRRGSCSVFGWSSDRNTTHVTLTCTAATCSDSSGELMSWGSDFSEVRIPRHREGRGDNSGLSFAVEKEGVGSGSGLVGTGGAGQEKDPLQGNESGYRGDEELGYGDEFDEDDEFDARHLLFWGDHRIRDTGIEGENKIGELKSHHRNRRKKIIM
ncbi:hypothetical protein FCM35_KLT00929 [Carex littledalei]|uniref:Uncharacterized protein n=1 Tax=Carex littledalei TaxID=544730 RepID=A0A833VSD6_9POAL|nr:hypothetical protein FCM35_KLT00929 [Carex littledalei]